MGDWKDSSRYRGCSPEFVVPKTWADRAVQNYRESKIKKAGVKVPMTWVDRINEGASEKWAKGGYVKSDREMRGDEITGLDAINPQHYQQYKGLEVIELTEQMNFNRGNAVKYVTRAGTKPGADEVEDLKKAKWYIEREIRRVENEDIN